MDLWQSEVEQTCTAEYRKHIDVSRDRVLQQQFLTKNVSKCVLRAHW